MNSSSEDEGDQIMSLDRERGTVLTKYLAPRVKPILIHNESGAGARPQTAKTVTLKTADGVVSPLNLDLINAKDEPKQVSSSLM